MHCLVKVSLATVASLSKNRLVKLIAIPNESSLLGQNTSSLTTYKTETISTVTKGKIRREQIYNDQRTIIKIK